MSNHLAKSALSGVIGTTFMTLFSIFASEKKGRQFREPEILSMLLKNLPIKKSNRIIIGWIAHYMVGVSFNMVNQKLLDKLQKSPTFLNGVLLGAANGAVGLAIWKAIFEAHPSPPKIGLNRYLAHLFLAHLIFASLANVSQKKVTAETAKEVSSI